MTEQTFAPLAFVDTETTGLDPDLHQVWEVALVSDIDPEKEHHWFLPVDLGRADPVALRIGRFAQRYDRGFGEQITDLETFAAEFAALTVGHHMVGMVPSFDEERLRKLLRANGACPEWHYHLVDAEALAAGLLGLAPPWDSDELSRAVGVDPGHFERHTALGDVHWTMAIYAAVMAWDRT